MHFCAFQSEFFFAFRREFTYSFYSRYSYHFNIQTIFNSIDPLRHWSKAEYTLLCALWKFVKLAFIKFMTNDFFFSDHGNISVLNLLHSSLVQFTFSLRWQLNSPWRLHEGYQTYTKSSKFCLTRTSDPLCAMNISWFKRLNAAVVDCKFCSLMKTNVHRLYVNDQITDLRIW
jgi:hypothetical protein